MRFHNLKIHLTTIWVKVYRKNIVPVRDTRVCDCLPHKTMTSTQLLVHTHTFRYTHGLLMVPITLYISRVYDYCAFDNSTQPRTARPTRQLNHNYDHTHILILFTKLMLICLRCCLTTMLHVHIMHNGSNEPSHELTLTLNREYSTSMR